MYNAVDSFDPMMVAPQPALRDNRASVREDREAASFDDHLRQDAARAAPETERSPERGNVQQADKSRETPPSGQSEETQDQPQAQAAPTEAEPANANAAATPAAKPPTPQDCGYLVQTLADAAPEGEPAIEPPTEDITTPHGDKPQKTNKAKTEPALELALISDQPPQPAQIQAPCVAQAPIEAVETDAALAGQHDDETDITETKAAEQSSTPSAPPLPPIAPRVEHVTPTNAKADNIGAIDAEAQRGAETGQALPTERANPETQSESARSDARGDMSAKPDSGRPAHQTQTPDVPNLNAAASPNSNQAPAFPAALGTADPLTTANASATQAASADAARTLPAHTQIGREIVRRFDGENTRFELRLDPPELGRVEIKLEVSRDHRVNAVVTTDNPQALADLTRSARELASALHSAGLELNENGLSFNLSQQQSQFAEQESNKRGAHQNTPTEIEPAAQPTQRLTLESWRGGRIDLVA
jgi:flagellar hook-length control protein FliK